MKSKIFTPFIFLKQSDASIKSTIIETASDMSSVIFNIGIPVGAFPYANIDSNIYQLFEIYNRSDSSTTSFGIRSINIYSNGKIEPFVNQQILVYYIPF